MKVALWLMSPATDGWFWPLAVSAAIFGDFPEWAGWLFLILGMVTAALDVAIWYLKRKTAGLPRARGPE